MYEASVCFKELNGMEQNCIFPISCPPNRNDLEKHQCEKCAVFLPKFESLLQANCGIIKRSRADTFECAEVSLSQSHAKTTERKLVVLLAGFQTKSAVVNGDMCQHCVSRLCRQKGDFMTRGRL